MDIGIVGGGIAGLHLALKLQQQRVATTLYTELSAADHRATRISNNVCRFESTRVRERELGVDHWIFPELGAVGANVHVTGEPAIKFRGDFAEPGSFVDFRLYLPRLLDDYEARGGRVVVKAFAAEDVVAASHAHDLMVVSSGRGALAGMFPRDPERSPFTAPQRHILAGFFHGVAFLDPMGLSFNIVPGLGEVFNSATYSFSGGINAILIEAIPGAAWEERVRQPYDGDLGRCAEVVLELLRESVPGVYERIDPKEFRLTGSRDLLQGAVTPTVRRPWVPLGNGKFAVAVGDAAVANDPILGQGANLSSRSAWTLGDAILDEFVFDERFCRWWEDRNWEVCRDVTEWTNAFLCPPPPHVIELLIAAMNDRVVADAFMSNFDRPRRNWHAMRSPEATAGFLRQLRAPRPRIPSIP